MAKTVVTTDDIDGSANAESVAFSIDGSSYTIDLGKKNKDALLKALKPYIDVATKTSGRGVRRTGATGKGRGPSGRTEDLAAVRTWAAENGHDVSPRGRISQRVLDAYHAR